MPTSTRTKTRKRKKTEKGKKIKEERKAKEDPPIETIDLRKPRTVSLEEKIKHDPVKEEDDIVILDEPKPKKFKSEEPDKERRIEMSQAASSLSYREFIECRYIGLFRISNSISYR